MDGTDGWYSSGVRYRAPYGAYNNETSRLDQDIVTLKIIDINCTCRPLWAVEVFGDWQGWRTQQIYSNLHGSLWSQIGVIWSLIHVFFGQFYLQNLKTLAGTKYLFKHFRLLSNGAKYHQIYQHIALSSCYQVSQYTSKVETMIMNTRNTHVQNEEISVQKLHEWSQNTTKDSSKCPIHWCN